MRQRATPHRAAGADEASAHTPMAFARSIALAYRRRGLAPDGALATAHIAPEDLAQPLARISARQLELLSGHAMRELDDEALGWFERALPWGSYGMLVRASISAPVLGVALRRWCRHHGLLTDRIDLQVQDADGVAHVTLRERHPIGAAREFCLVSVLRNLHGVACWLVDSHIPLQAAWFPFARPPHHAVYPVLFPCAVTFGQDSAGIRFDAGYLALPLRRDEAALNRMLQHALPLLVHRYRRDRLLLERTRQALTQPDQPARESRALARALHVSPRTLHRHLRAEGASVQALKDAARYKRATELLLRSSQPIKQVAHAVGYASDKSFIRAFRGWTGQTPAAFRRAGGSPAQARGAPGSI